MSPKYKMYTNAAYCVQISQYTWHDLCYQICFIYTTALFSSCVTIATCTCTVSTCILVTSNWIWWYLHDSGLHEQLKTSKAFLYNKIFCYTSFHVDQHKAFFSSTVIVLWHAVVAVYGSVLCTCLPSGFAFKMVQTSKATLEIQELGGELHQWDSNKLLFICG